MSAWVCRRLVSMLLRRISVGSLIVVAGGRAGKFSAVLGGWVGGKMGSVAVTREIVD